MPSQGLTGGPSIMRYLSFQDTYLVICQPDSTISLGERTMLITHIREKLADASLMLPRVAHSIWRASQILRTRLENAPRNNT